MASAALMFRIAPRVGPVWYAVVVCQSAQGREWERHVTGRVVRELSAGDAARVRRVPRVPNRPEAAVSFYLW